MIRTLVPARKVVIPQEGLRWIVKLTIFALSFAVAVLSLLLFILFDLAPSNGLSRGREYEAIRIAVELFALVGTAVMTIWILRFRAVCRRQDGE